MTYKLQKKTNHIPEGEYFGCISGCSMSADLKYVWLLIEVNETQEILNVSIPVISTAYIQFAEYFVDENNEYDTEDFIDTMVRFTVYDKEIGGTVYSKISEILPIDEEEGA